jgi:small conductance mechanosensitive channel
MEKAESWLNLNMASIVTMALGVGLLILANWYWLKRTPELGAEKKLPRQVGMLALTVLVLLVIILALPINDTTRGQILSLLGIVITAIIALSSTTFVANAMAGLMLRLVDTFRPGDYLRFNDQLCRVTERGLFHTEVQNEDKDLITYPNLFLVTNAVTVISHTGTLITCSVSLGYDVSREKIEKNLVAAAESIGLETPFVLIKSLGDFSVSYKVSGFLTEVKSLVTWRSNLHKAVLDHLHGGGIEVVSPNFMNSRQLDVNKQVIPLKSKVNPIEITEHQSVEEKIFDKAEVASDRELLMSKRDLLLAELTLAAEKSEEKKVSQLELELKKLDAILLEMNGVGK